MDTMEKVINFLKTVFLPLDYKTTYAIKKTMDDVNKSLRVGIANNHENKFEFEITQLIRMKTELHDLYNESVERWGKMLKRHTRVLAIMIFFDCAFFKLLIYFSGEIPYLLLGSTIMGIWFFICNLISLQRLPNPLENE